MYLLELLSHILFLFLHVTGSGTFPKALTPAQEKRCLEEMARGSPGARRRLIEHNLRLVAHIVKKYYASPNDQEDLVSIGTIGLIKAIDTFDPKKGIRLSSYASRCIENEILMFFRSGRKTAQDVSLNDPIDTDKDGNALTILDTMAVDDTIVDSIDVKLKSEKLYRFLRTALTPRERGIVCMRYGLEGFSPQPQRVVAKCLGISRSYVSRRRKCKRSPESLVSHGFPGFLHGWVKSFGKIPPCGSGLYQAAKGLAATSRSGGRLSDGGPAALRLPRHRRPLICRPFQKNRDNFYELFFTWRFFSCIVWDKRSRFSQRWPNARKSLGRGLPGYFWRGEGSFPLPGKKQGNRAGFERDLHK